MTTKARVEPFPWECGVHFCDACGDCLACQWESSCGPPFDGPEWLAHVYASDEYCFALPIDKWVMGPDGRPMPVGRDGQPVEPDMVPD